MVKRVDIAFVELWGDLVGAVNWDSSRGFAAFEYDKPFLEKGLDLAPLKMPLAEARQRSPIFDFRALPKQTFQGLPGLLADTLPDNFGNAIIDTWLAQQGRTRASFSPVERLCYIGKRGMGALEFSPVIDESVEESVPVEISELIKLAQKITDDRSKLTGKLEYTSKALLNIIRVGTSAGGNRPKAVLAFNPETKEVRSGQVSALPGFEYWVLKFDGVTDQSLGDPAGYGRIEYAYYKMATAARINMMKCQLLEEDGRAHFMTQRFDRTRNGDKLHMLSLCAMAHFDFNSPGAYSYEQVFQVMRQLRLPYKDAEQQFRRMVFNVVARNQDDHTKNISFLMDKNGVWRLSPAYDVIYSYNPAGPWTSMHQMSIAGKRDQFTRDDLNGIGQEMNIKSSNKIIDEIVETVSDWPSYAKDAGVEQSQVEGIGIVHRLL
ncbi:type II toxin-antitoxin system HipA family toxin [candidate division KSB1 bacterium]|nr:type II toxin-antitoxin system HipA family toxin [candidate division KSB1 bacterium]